MNSVDIEIEPDVIRVSYGGGHPPEVIENAAVIDDKQRIQAIGSVRAEGPAIPNTTYRVFRIFDGEVFYRDLAQAATEYFATRSDRRSGNLIRWALGRGAVRIRWPEWPSLSVDDRRSFLEAVARTANVEINGRVAIHGTWARSILRLRPTVESWAVAPPRDG
jgi:hypothetical protein